MAHLHHSTLGMLRDMTTGFPDFSTEQSGVCRGCALGKYTKTAFLSSDSRLEGVLELIHSDLCCPMSSASLTGFEYYITFIDDFFRKTWIYFLRSKKSEEVLLWRTKQERRSGYLDQIMGVSILLMLSMSFVDKTILEGN